MKKIYEKPLTQCEEALFEAKFLALSPKNGGLWTQEGVDPNDPSEGSDEDARGNFTINWDRMEDHL